MAEIPILEALDGAQLVKAETVHGQTTVQVWHGGTTVNVYRVETQHEDTWYEVTCWNVSDDEGRPVERYEMEKHMAMWFGRLREEGV